jgi:hypothetical protein
VGRVHRVAAQALPPGHDFLHEERIEGQSARTAIAFFGGYILVFFV